MKNVILMFLSISSILIASALQTDWSGGIGTSIYSGNWSNTFESCNAAAWQSIAGQLTLSSEPLAECSSSTVSEELTKPYTADCGDINGDGYTDILVGTYQSDEVVVWYGDEYGSWEKQDISQTTDGCCGSDLADIDGDGDLDILIATYTGGRIILFLNQGGLLPAWEEEVVTTAFDGAHDVEAVDMDNDGDLDIVATAAEINRVSWFRNDPDTWIEKDVSESVYYPCRIHPVDIDENGSMDIVCAGYGSSSGPSSITVMYGSGGQNPTWTEEIIDNAISGAHGIRAVDIDDDGDLDLVSAAMNSGRTYLYTKNANEWTRSTIGLIPACAIVKPADMDGDGDYDIVVSSFGSGGVSWWDNLGAGQWARRVVKTGGGSTSCVIPADLDNDGKLDILSTRFTAGVIEQHTVSSFLPAGNLISSILDIECSPDWAGVSWLADVPISCLVGIKYRSSENPANLGEWSDILWNPAFISGELKRYFQYEVILQSSDPAVSPIFHSLELDWNLQGVESETVEILTVVNPSYGSIQAMVGEPNCTLKVFNLLGRLVYNTVILSEGLIQLPEFPVGNYTLVLFGDTGRIARRSVAVLPR